MVDFTLERILQNNVIQLSSGARKLWELTHFDSMHGNTESSHISVNKDKGRMDMLEKISREKAN